MKVFFKKIIYKIIHWFWRIKYPEEELSYLGKEHIQNLKIILDREALFSELPNNGVGAEIGVEHGLNARNIIKLNSPQNLHLVDLWTDSTVLETCKKELQEFSNLIYHRMSSLNFLEGMSDNSLDWIYIDSDHGYKITREELHEAARVVKDDGFICGHDYTLISSNGIRRYGVIQAVNEFCLSNSYEMIYLSHEAHRHLSYALKKMT